MELRPFVNILAAAKVAKEGKSLFLYEMPPVENAILLREETTGMRIDYELPGYFKGAFQVVVRDTEYEPARQKMKQVIKTLTMEGTYVEGSLVNYCRPRTQPSAFQMTNGKQVEFSVMMDICYCDPEK